MGKRPVHQTCERNITGEPGNLAYHATINVLNRWNGRVIDRPETDREGIPAETTVSNTANGRTTHKRAHAHMHTYTNMTIMMHSHADMRGHTNTVEVPAANKIPKNQSEARHQKFILSSTAMCRLQLHSH